MKRAVLCALALVSSLTFSASASEGFDDLVKLAKAGVGEEVLVAYVNAAPKPYALTVDEILYLNDIGVPETVVAAAIRRGNPNAPVPNLAEGPLLEPQPVPVDQVVTKPEVPAVQPPFAPDYDQAVKDAVAKANGQPVSQPIVVSETVRPATPQEPFGPTVDPVVGRPEPVLATRPEVVYQPATPATQPVVITETREREPVREVVREVVVERPVYVETVVAPPEDRLNVSFFYESLSPYGSWLSVDNDYYWQPSVVHVDRSWRPYWNNGYWVYTDYGWTWKSNYSWGWAPFHYGRWTCHNRHGWIWRPDTVWAPAWVHWRSNDAYAGWAPLPPEARYESGVGFHYRGKNVSLDFHFGLGERDYAFVPVRNFCDHDFHRHGSYYGYNRGPQVTNIYNNTTIVNNYYRYDRDRIINNGPGYDSIRRATNRDIRPVRITDAGYRSGDAIRPTSLRDDTLSIYRPNIRRDTPETPQVAIARRDEEIRRVQAERDRNRAQLEAQRVREAARTGGTITSTNTGRDQARREAASRENTAARENAARDEQRRAQLQAENNARENARRAEAANRERAEAAARDEQRRAQLQAENNARENARRAENANRERAEAAARDEQRRAQMQAENNAREQARRVEAANRENAERARRQEDAVREQAERAARDAASRERSVREAQSRAAVEEQQRRLDQAQRDAARQIEQSRRDAQRQADVQSRQEAAREAALRAQQQAASREAAQAQAAQREELARQQNQARQQALEEQRRQQSRAESRSSGNEGMPSRSARDAAREEARSRSR